MKLHRPLVNTVLHTLRQIFEGGQYADKAVEQALKDPRLGSRDRRFIAENVYGMVRWWRLLSEISGHPEKDYLPMFAAWFMIRGKELPDWEELSSLSPEKVMQRYEEVRKVRKLRESVPDWLDSLGSAELGEAVWEKELHALNEEAKVVLRSNRLRTGREELQSGLLKEGVQTIADEHYPDALVLEKRQQLQSLKLYRQGYFEVQDASSQLIAPFMELQPGQTVIDACAGAGGKSLHIAAMMENKGQVISMDVEERKLSELKRRADRAGAKIIRTEVITAGTIGKRSGQADRLLLDVPCSGLGVLRRNPDAKWKLSENFMKEIKQVQQDILREYSSMLKPGGILVYATCSILPGENQLQVEKFLESNPGFEFISDRKIMPSEGFDGFYMAKLRKV